MYGFVLDFLKHLFGPRFTIGIVPYETHLGMGHQPFRASGPKSLSTNLQGPDANRIHQFN